MATDEYSPEICTKTCKTCGESFPATSEYFSKTGNLYTPLRAHCKTCTQAAQRQALEQRAHEAGQPIPGRRFRRDKRSDGLRECSICHRLLAATTEFFYRKTDAERSSLTRQCQECLQAKDQRKRTKNFHLPKLRHDGLRECSACHALLPETREFFPPRPESLCGLQRQCRPCKQARQPKRRRSKAKRKVSRDQNMVNIHRRRTRKYAKPHTFTVDDAQFARTYWQQRCAVCGTEEGFWWKLQMDHWIPLSHPDCPGTVPTNMVPLCGGLTGCNQSKSRRMPEPWLKQKFGPRKAAAILRRIEAFFLAASQRQHSA